MSHDLSQPIRTGSETESSEKTDESTKEGPHSVGVWTLKISKDKNFDPLGDSLKGNLLLKQLLVCL